MCPGQAAIGGAKISARKVSAEQDSQLGKPAIDELRAVEALGLLYLDGRIELSPAELGAMLVRIVLDGIRKRAT